MATDWVCDDGKDESCVKKPTLRESEAGALSKAIRRGPSPKPCPFSATWSTPRAVSDGRSIT